MTEQEKIQILIKKINDADAIVVGTASGMSAAGGLRYYYQDDDDYKKIAGGLREKYGDKNLFDAYYDRRIAKGEHWALLLRSIKHLYDIDIPEVYIELYEILHGKNYYIVTTNQDAQLFRVFPEDKITRLQGDARYFQCKNRCHDKIYYNKEIIDELIPKIQNDSLPEDLIPVCPRCGGEMVDWVRSREFLQGKEYEREYNRYIDFIRRNADRKILFLELGVGMMTPMFIKEPFMNMTYQLPDAYYITVNPKHAIIPKEIASKSLDIQDDIAFVLKGVLGKSTDNLRRQDKDNIFDSGRIY
ncbi:NAD-dependent protein deacetylase [Duncaniella freteri]|jgi:NAD-dependent SIR2 family protein deacetylase|uniref:NAD-dependent protein deacetylase n=1 Tax=Duncaniella freteri TaxID=2530391 RepID=A0A4Z0V7E5_9BACT|nr:NAD-dependent protein deacetylase [Duncaniella freteri]TGG40701.1 NAD-dependent protein deacetylase [Duncaniella freteri]